MMSWVHLKAIPQSLLAEYRSDVLEKYAGLAEALLLK